MATLDNKKMLIGGSAVGGIVLMYLVLSSMSPSSKYGAPCFCKKCEGNLVDAAQNGDVIAQQRLRSSSIRGGYYEGKAFGSLGPLAFIPGMAIMLAILYGAYKISQAGKPYTSGIEATISKSIRGK